MIKFCYLLVVLISSVSCSNFQKGIIIPERCFGAPYPIEMRVSNCSELPCELHPNQQYTIETDFIATGDSEGLTFKLTVDFFDHQFEEWNRPIVNSTVAAGEPYTVTYVLTPSPLSSGYNVQIQVEIMDTATGRVEACAHAAAILL